MTSRVQKMASVTGLVHMKGAMKAGMQAALTTFSAVHRRTWSPLLATGVVLRQADTGVEALSLANSEGFLALNAVKGAIEEDVHLLLTDASLARAWLRQRDLRRALTERASMMAADKMPKEFTWRKYTCFPFRKSQL